MLFVLAAVIFLPSCHRQGSAAGEVWAEVDGQPILRDQVEKIYRSRASTGNASGDTEEAASFKINILNELINNQILVAHALHSGITVSEAEVDTKIAQLQSPYSKEEFEQKLKERGMEMDDLRREVKTSLIINKLINRDIDSKISVSAADIESYYNHSKANFNVPENEYHLAQIEVTPGPDAEVRNLKNDDAKNPVVAEHKIQALYAQLRAGVDFSTLAQNYSEDPRSALNGGDMGYIPASSLDSNPQIKRVVQSLKAGQISGIIKTQSGYHIVELLGVEQAGQRQVTDPQVQATIRKTLTNEKEQLLKAAFIEVLRDRAKVKNLLAEKIVQQNGSFSK